MTEYIIISLLIVLIIIAIVLILKISAIKGDLSDNKEIDSLNNNIKNIGDLMSKNQELQYRGVAEKLNDFDKNINEKISTLNSTLSEKQETNQKYISTFINQQEERFKTFSSDNNIALENIRSSVEKSLTSIQNDNNKRLDEMRGIVDEKLQKSIEEKMTNSFSLVNERLEQVYKGLGEMQTIATGVGDLKKVLTNVKTRGILGEIQLGAILSEILAPEQYEENVAVVKGSANRVEFAIKMPGEADSFVYLPIDSKFPGDAYRNLVDAYENGVKEEIDLAVKNLITVIKNEAADINKKYINPPETTDFAIMFLPFEGLYSEVVNRGMVEELQKKYKVNIAGPSTMAALLNSLQMGFKTLAIQKRTSEVWEVLSAVKTEFEKFSDVLDKTQNNLAKANSELDKLVGTRTRMINSKLNKITKLQDSSRVDEILNDE